MKVLKHYRAFLIALSITVFGGCATISYYSQSVVGHLSVWMKRQDIEQMIADRRTKPKLKRRLKLILMIRQFASDELALPSNYSFKSYVALRRKHIVWNVIAAPEFSVEPVRFCFPVVGCLSYKGYYAKKRAIKEAAALRKKGLDVAVGGVNAYSTLGYFADPVLSTYVWWPEPDLAGLLFHELAHQMIYLKGDTTFNESFATAVEIEGVKRWMKKQGKPALFKKFYLIKQREDQFMRLVLKTRKRLKTLYASKRPAADMRKRKKQIFNQMRADYRKLKKKWQGFSAYDAYMNRDLNNANIVSAATYFEYVKAFQIMLKRHKGNFKAFYQEVYTFGKLTIQQRRQKLQKILAQSS